MGTGGLDFERNDVERTVEIETPRLAMETAQ